MQSIRSHLSLMFVLSVAACGSNNGNKEATDAPAKSIDAPASTGDGPTQAADISLSTAGGLGAHLVDSTGKTLYFFVNDIADSNASTYSGAAWPVFDVQSPTVGAGLSASDFSRFDRGSNVYQTTWNGRPLYYYANDTTADPTAGEGIGGRWFVARGYTLFFYANAAVTPQGGSADAPFLTDGAGRSVYVFSNDTRGSGATAPTSACTGGCATHWPLLPAVTTVVLPSTVPTADVTSFTNGSSQFVFMGWPLYYYASDTGPGEYAGASVADWYAANGAWDGTMAQ
jgi:predicted lipoprotein with Yx(FWY)xxD motif